MVTKLTNFLEENADFTQTRVSAAIGISVSALNAWMKGSYKGDNARIERAVSRFLEAQAEAGEETGKFKKDFGFVETSIYTDVLNAVNLAEYRGEIRTVTGVSGVGKTMAIKHIKKLRESSLVLVEAYPGMRKTRFMRKLCDAAGFDGIGTYDDMFEELSRRLKDTGRLIAIDESEHLTIESVDAARRLNDFTGCGVVFIGLPRFYKTLKSKQDDFAYVYNRTAMPTLLKRNKQKDLEAMAATLNVTLSSKLLLNACNGIGRDLRIILLESLRVAADNSISASDNVAFPAIVDRVSKKLARRS